MDTNERGFTLVEVLCALSIMSVIITLAINTFEWQTKLSKENQGRLETHQALRAAMMTVEKEVRLAKTITLVNQGEIRLIRNNNQSVRIYVADKDYNGVKDVYLEADGVPNPVASYVDELIFTDKGLGKWEVDITARQGGVETKWKLIIKQRIS